MRKNDLMSNFDIVKNYANFLKTSYLPISPLDELMVSEQQRWSEVEKLGQSIRNENCYLITNILDFSIVFAKNMEILGVNSLNTDKTKYLCLASSGGFLELSMLYNKIIVEISLIEPKYLSFLNPKFISQLPITKPNGEVILIKKTLSPFQYTSSGKIFSNLAEFTIIKENYNNEPMEPRYMNSPEPLIVFFKEMIRKKFIEECSPFSPKEINIMKGYYQNPDFTLTQLAAELSITFETLKSYNKSIITKAKEYMGPLFTLKNAKDVSVFFERCSVI